MSPFFYGFCYPCSVGPAPGPGRDLGTLRLVDRLQGLNAEKARLEVELRLARDEARPRGGHRDTRKWLSPPRIAKFCMVVEGRRPNS